MTNSRVTPILIASILLICALLVLVVAIERLAARSGLLYVALIAAGMFTAAALGALQQLSQGGFRVRVSFHEQTVSAALRVALSEMPREWQLEVSAETTPSEPRGLGPEQLVATEPALALAKLRLDLEETLRQVASRADVELGTLAAGPVAMAEELVGRDALPAALVMPVRAIARATSHAIHGADVPPDVAAAVVRVGAVLNRALRGVSPPSNHHDGTGHGRPRSASTG